MSNLGGEKFALVPYLPCGQISGRSVYDAVEDFAAEHRIRRATIWQDALQAYRSGALPKRYRNGIEVPPGWSLDSILDNSIRGALAAVSQEDFNTAHWRWIKCLAAGHELDRWLARWPLMRTKRPKASGAAVKAEVQRYLADEETHGITPSQKRAWEWVKHHLPGARYRQVVEKLPRRPRGRPARRKSARR